MKLKRAVIVSSLIAHCRFRWFLGANLKPGMTTGRAMRVSIRGLSCPPPRSAAAPHRCVSRPCKVVVRSFYETIKKGKPVFIATGFSGLAAAENTVPGM
jgi:hypothetical protein